MDWPNTYTTAPPPGMTLGEEAHRNLITSLVETAEAVRQARQTRAADVFLCLYADWADVCEAFPSALDPRTQRFCGIPVWLCETTEQALAKLMWSAREGKRVGVIGLALVAAWDALNAESAADEPVVVDGGG